MRDHPLPVLPDKDTGHAYRALSTALVDQAPQILHPGNAALKVKTVTGHCRHGLGGLPDPTIYFRPLRCANRYALTSRTS